MHGEKTNNFSYNGEGSTTVQCCDKEVTFLNI